jgi:hypothetical protein
MSLVLNYSTTNTWLGTAGHDVDKVIRFKAC